VSAQVQKVFSIPPNIESSCLNSRLVLKIYNYNRGVRIDNGVSMNRKCVKMQEEWSMEAFSVFGKPVGLVSLMLCLCFPWKSVSTENAEWLHSERMGRQCMNTT
jgi:hypothetical protein